jgi:hypothetical protein
MTIDPRRILKALQPIEGKDGKTSWRRIGTAFPNRDNSINLYLDSFPRDGKVQLRELDEDDLRSRDPDAPRRTRSADARPSPASSAGEDLPF